MIQSIPHLSLGKFPTPAQHLPNLGRVLGMPSLWIKRDDLSGPLGGGNKVRKLEYIFAAAQQQAQGNGPNHITLFTIGPTGSNHVRATVVYGKSAGFRVECLLFQQPTTEYSELNYTTIREHAEQIYEVKYMGTMFARYASEKLKNAFGIGRKRYFIPAGGSSALGSLGYVTAVEELKSQIEAGYLPEPRFIFVPVGTCGTMAGLVAGVRLAGLRSQVIGVRVSDRVIANTWLVSWMVQRILRLIGTANVEPTNALPIEIWHHDFGKGYGIPTEEGTRAVKMMREHEDITLENTYTGKTLAGLIHYLQVHSCEKQPVLFWHTFGGGANVNSC